MIKLMAKIEKAVSGIYASITDLNLKLYHVIEETIDRYSKDSCPYYNN